MSKFNIYRAIFFSKNGKQHSKKKININQSKFSHNGGKYHINPHASFRKKVGIIFNTYEYFYVVGIPDPIIFNDKEPNFNFFVDSEQYETLLETKVIRDANEMDKQSLLGNIQMKHVLIVIGVIALGVYLLQGGSIV